MDPGQRPQPLRSYQPAVQWPSQGYGSAPQPAYRYRGRNLLQVHTGDNQWLAKARNFTAAHTLVECGGYGYVAINSSGPIDLGSDEATGLLTLTLTHRPANPNPNPNLTLTLTLTLRLWAYRSASLRPSC